MVGKTNTGPGGIKPSIFSYHNDMKLEIKNWRKSGKLTRMGKLNSTLLSKQWVKEEIKKEIKKKDLKTKQKHNIQKPTGFCRLSKRDNLQQ